MHNAQCTMHNAQRTMQNAQCTVHGADQRLGAIRVGRREGYPATKAVMRREACRHS